MLRWRNKFRVGRQLSREVADICLILLITYHIELSHSLLIDYQMQIMSSYAATVETLIDFGDGNFTTAGYNATIADFSNSGVVEDLTGASVEHFYANHNTTSGNTNKSWTGSTANVLFAGTTNGGYDWNVVNPLVRDGVYLNNRGPITVTVSNITIAEGTEYKLYLWGNGGGANQNSTFTFNGSSLVATSGAFTTPVVYDFDSTGSGVTANSITFTWDRTGSQQYGAINGLAIVAVPEPSTYAAIAGFLALGWVMLRRRQ